MESVWGSKSGTENKGPQVSVKVFAVGGRWEEWCPQATWFILGCYVFFPCPSVAGKGTPSRAQNWAVVQHSEKNCLRRHVLTKQEILLGKGTQVESSRVREPRRTALSHGLQSWVLW